MQDLRQLRIQQAAFGGGPVVYVMSRDQRVRDNHALLAAQALALEHSVPLYVLFVLRRLPNRSREHYQFMLDGLSEVAAGLDKLQIPFVLREGDDAVQTFAAEVQAGALFFDFSPLHGARELVRTVASSFAGPVTVVDTHNIIPAWAVSDKQEFAAHTLRPKVHRHLQAYLVEPGEPISHPHAGRSVHSLSFEAAEEFIQQIPACGIEVDCKPGETAARARLGTFIASELAEYARARNDFAADGQSGLSPYLHFGQIASLRVALDVVRIVGRAPLLFKAARMAQAGDEPSAEDGMNALFEEMIVRKELSDNFCLYGSSYRSLDGAAGWARQTLREHAGDPREFLYSKDEWEAAATHDAAWNAAQTQLKRTGKLHGYMRMYWAKKLLEWSKTPEDAIATAIHLNDTYSIDGGDPNGYVGILWSIAGLHDRPWFERSVYGKIRYMNAGGLQRKADLQTYIDRWS